MSTSFRAMTGVLSIQIDSFKRGLTEAGYSVQRLKVQASAAFQAIDVAADKASDGVEESSKKMRAAVKAAAESFTAAIRAVDSAVMGMSTTVGRFMFDTAASVGKMGFELLKLRDNALLSFTALTGSAERAKTLLRDLESFAASTPFELPGLVSSAQKLIGFGVKAEEVIPILRSLGNAAVGVGGSPEQVDRMVAALGAMKAAGQITTDQMQALQETGVPAWETLAQVIGRSVQETQRLTEQGVVKTDLVFDAFVAALGNRFAGLMDKQSQTLGGMIANLTKAFQGAAATIFQPLYDAATKFLTWAQSENGINLDGIVGRLQAVIARVAAALDSFLRANGEVILRALAEGFIEVGNAVAALITNFEVNGDAIKTTVKAWYELALAVVRFIATYPELSSNLIALRASFETGIPQAIWSVVKFFWNLGGAIVETIKHFLGLQKAGKTMFGTGFLQSIAKAVTSFGKWIWSLGILKSAFQFLRGVGGWISTVFTAVMGRLGGFAKAIGVVRNALGAMRFVAVGLRAGLIGAFAAVIAYLALKLHPAVRQLSKELERAAEYAKRLEVLRQGQRDRTFAEIEAVKDPKEKRKQFETEKKREESDLAEQEKQLTAAKKALEEAEANGVAEEANLKRQEVALTEARIAATQQQIAKLEERIAAFDQETPELPLPPDDPAAADPKEPETVRIEEKPDTRIDDAVAEAQARAMERDNPMLKGFGELKEFVLGGANFGQIEAFTKTIEGMTPELAAAFARSLEEGWNIDDAIRQTITAANENIQKEERTETVGADMERMNKDMEGLPDEALVMFTQQMEQLSLHFINGVLTQQEYAEGLDILREKISNAKNVQEELKTSMEQYGEVLAGPFKTRFEELRQQLKAGEIGIDQFRKEVKGLTEASQKAAEAEKRRKLLAGDFAGAGLDLKAAVEERLASKKMQEFNTLADNIANRLTGASEKVQDFSQDVKKAGDAAQSFSEKVPSADEVSNFWQRLSQFMQTIDGQRALILNQIALLRQSMQITKDALSQRELQAKIDDLIRALQVLDQQEAALPTFIGDRGELEFKDPALSKDGGGGGRRGVFGPDGNGGGGGISLSFPNLTRITQTEASLLADAVVRETSRRGRALSR